ncbi:Wzz/FepE/Etk N-terminal domain-containing protein [Gammaproteobacteria bacterium]|nr:Wzz/FepE/Etk N-terminal domain-containing protein [Gammaproteobacteria bacterium]
MHEINNNKNIKELDDEINLLEFFYILMREKWIIVSVTAFISIIGVIYSISIPNIYQSKALLVPSDSSSIISGAMGRYSGIAGLAGINIPSVGEKNNSTKAIKKINSLSFFENNILSNIFLPDLMAVQSWNSKTNELIYDDSIYNSSSNTWLKSSSNKGQIPSAQEAFKVFITQNISLSEDKSNGFITISIKHQSPFIAKQWVDLVVNEINSFYRKKDKLESERAVIYLSQQISVTSLSEIKQVIAELLQEETQKLTLIEANQSYVFEYIDPPAVMEKKSEPQRALICILSALLGGMLSIVIVLLKHYSFKEKTM